MKKIEYTLIELLSNETKKAGKKWRLYEKKRYFVLLLGFRENAVLSHSVLRS